MSEIDRQKWQQRYREGSYRRANPVDLLRQWAAQVPSGRALDVACGAGRNAIFLAEAGFVVDAIDISAEGLKLARRAARARHLDINWIEHDLDRDFGFAADYALIVVLWFVDLPLIERLGERLAPGGLLISEQHLATAEPVAGPRSNAFRVAPGALAAAAGKLRILHYREAAYVDGDGEPMASAQLVARREP